MKGNLFTWKLRINKLLKTQANRIENGKNKERKEQNEHKTEIEDNREEKYKRRGQKIPRWRKIKERALKVMKDTNAKGDFPPNSFPNEK